MASGVEGVSAAFVVDRKGNVAYIEDGYPRVLADVLDKVLKGNWTAVMARAKAQANAPDAHHKHGVPPPAK